jgi:hypothetical protein
MGKVVDRARPYLRATLFVAFVGQVFLATCGRVVPDSSDLYGAPLPVGESSGLTFDIMGGFSTFFLPFWILDVLVTAVVLLVVATVLHGRTLSGVVAATVSVFVAYVIAFLLPSSEHRANQLLIWVWMLLVVSAAWGINRLMARKAER